jgi:hypothetical protein
MAKQATQKTKKGEKTLTARIEKTTSSKANNYVLDLKVNSPASLDYLSIDGLESAPAMVRLSKVKGLDVIAITDLYSGDFVDPLVSAAKGSRLTVIPGVSVRCSVGSCTDVILSCLFPETTTSDEIRSFLSELDIPTDAAKSSSYIVPHPMDSILHVLDSKQGVAIPTRIDKTPHRLSALGDLVETYGFRAFDLAYADTAHVFKQRWPKLKFSLFSFSDAYGLAQIGSRSARVKMAAPGFDGVREIVARQSL